MIRIRNAFTALVPLSISVMRYASFSFVCHITGVEGAETRILWTRTWHDKFLGALADQKVGWNDLWPPIGTAAAEEEALSRHRRAMALTYNSSISKDGTV